ncbi:hypothetical protein AK812_SmicGene16376 [Symbiodinium microadriaticum]|uniref:Uncharacterized protein n=1 Tax=Symbiodinium microadriaticum TaxID=2951 RepID=A0A1Q9E0K0_SYMMI|nr:hypothetical protein AK812_SmicGene16376 [Symbiodinium microadriaticum]
MKEASLFNLWCTKSQGKTRYATCSAGADHDECCLGFGAAAAEFGCVGWRPLLRPFGFGLSAGAAPPADWRPVETGCRAVVAGCHVGDCILCPSRLDMGRVSGDPILLLQWQLRR